MTLPHTGVAMSPARRLVPKGMRAPLVLLLLLVLVALAAPALTPYEPSAQPDIVALRSQAPSLAHPFGTDQYSRDVLSRVLYGARISLRVAALAVTIALFVGVLYGTLAALAGGVVDSIMMRVLDVLLAIPRLLVLLAITAFWSSLSVTTLVLLLGFTGWFDVARLVRAETLGLLGRDFVMAAQAGGVRAPRLVWRHILPHLLPTLTVSATLGVAYTIAMETGLSYLGLGLQEPTASWGTILHSGADTIGTQWWVTLFPGLATVFAVLACNALGDALREVFAAEQVPA